MTIVIRAVLILGVAVGAFLPMSGAAGQPDVQRGHNFAQANCGQCHAIGQTGESPLPKAPPFHTLHLRYPVEYLVNP